MGASAGAAVLAKATGTSAQQVAGSTVAGSSVVPSLPGRRVTAGVFALLQPGARIDRWVVVQVYSVSLGAVPVVLVGEDALPFQLDVLRRDTTWAAVGESPSLAVYVVNGGAGTQRTYEDHGLAAMALAAHLAEREAAGAVVPELLTHRERTTRHPQGIFNVLK